MKLASAARGALCALIAVTGVASTGFGQQQQLVEEVVARVNAEVIMRSQYLEVVEQTEREIREAFPPDEAAKKIAEMRPKMLDAMIDNILIVQKGQDLGIDVEADVNAQFKRLAEAQQMTITEFEDAMRKSGVDPADARQRVRERLVRDRVMNQEVYGAVYRGLTDKEKRDYYEANKDKFMEPGELKLSELYLPVEGRSFTEIEAKGRDIVIAARTGSSFADLVKKNGDPSRPSYSNGGSLGSFKSADDLAAPLAAAIKNLQTGQVTDPIRMADGVIIIKVDERREAAAKPFDKVEQDVALAIVYDRSQEAEAAYVKELRRAAYIHVSPEYDAVAAAPAPSATPDKQ